MDPPDTAVWSYEVPFWAGVWKVTTWLVHEKGVTDWSLISADSKLRDEVTSEQRKLCLALWGEVEPGHPTVTSHDTCRIPRRFSHARERGTTAALGETLAQMVREGDNPDERARKRQKAEAETAKAA